MKFLWRGTFKLKDDSHARNGWWSLICVHTVVKILYLTVSCHLKHLKSGFLGFVPWWILRWLHTFRKFLFLATFGCLFICSPFPPCPLISHSTICMVWKKKNQNHQQPHYDVLFYKEARWQPVFFFFCMSLKSTQQRERQGAFIKTQPFCAPLFVWPDSYHCTESPRTTKLCLKAKLLISGRNIFWRLNSNTSISQRQNSTATAALITQWDEWMFHVTAGKMSLTMPVIVTTLCDVTKGFDASVKFMWGHAGDISFIPPIRGKFPGFKPSKQTIAAGLSFTTQIVNLVLLITDGKHWCEFPMKQRCEKWKWYNTAKQILCGWINWSWSVWFYRLAFGFEKAKNYTMLVFTMWGNKELQYSSFSSFMSPSTTRNGLLSL